MIIFHQDMKRKKYTYIKRVRQEDAGAIKNAALNLYPISL